MITPDIAKNLPRTLELIEERLIFPEAIPYIPDTFVELEVHPEGDYAHITSLPSKLRYLGLYSPPLRIFDILPPALTRLRLERGQNPIKDVERLFNGLPPTLTSLEAHSVYLLKSFLKPVPTPSHSSLMLPRGIKTLELSCLDFSDSSMAEWILGLPPNLTRLKICCRDLQRGGFTSLRVLVALEYLSFTVINSPGGKWAQFLDFPALPRHLIEFNLLPIVTDPYECDITNGTFLGAPLSLQSLNLPKSYHVTKDSSVHLPNLATQIWDDLPPLSDWDMFGEPDE
jgi:hypothetical protein